jgi:hypothetical protein
MKISKLVLVCAALGMGATLTVNANQVVVAPTAGSNSATFVSLPIQGKVVKGMPYSAEFVSESIQTLSDGNRIVKKTTGRVFRDVEGRFRREEDRPAGGPLITITDPVAQASWTLNTETKTARETLAPNFAAFATELGRVIARTGPAPAGGQGAARGGGGGSVRSAGGGGTVTPIPEKPGTRAIAGGGGRGGGVGGRRGTDSVEEALPNKSIENLLCTGVRRTTTIAAGTIGNEQPIKIVSEEWTSIDLQVLVLTDLNDPRTGRSTYKLQNVRRSDPDLMLFKVPADYTVTKAVRRDGGN